MTVQTRESVALEGEHVVQFYDDDADLIRSIGGELIRVIATGDAAIVIATGAHRLAFEADLIGAGIDTNAAVADGTLVWLDAADTMARFIGDGRIDREACHELLGDVVRRANQTGRPVWAYGEMVTLLWDAGNVLGAIEVEKLWNVLRHELRFSLRCGYRTDSVAGDEHADALHEVCGLHTAVVHDATAQFEAGDSAPSAARRFLARLLARRPYGDRVPVNDAHLVLSELATNAVIHAATPFSVSVSCDASALRIAVRDRCATRPVLRAAEPAARSGQGLNLVAAVARDWGVEPAPDGKTVWAELLLLR
jgi:anti-sigma regulatory factor (Ser/Thr protein kinase)